MIGGMFLFWIALIGLSVFLVRGLFQPGPSALGRQPLSAREILKERYARGEINKEEYELMLKDLL